MFDNAGKYFIELEKEMLLVACGISTRGRTWRRQALEVRYTLLLRQQQKEAPVNG